MADLSIPVDPAVERHYRHNFVVNVLDGLFFWGGASFIATTTVLPAYVSRLTDSRFLIGLLSTIASTGWLVPQLFTANRVQRLSRKKDWPVRIGFYSERLPLVLLALSVLLAWRYPTWALAAFFVCFTWHVVGAGFIAVAWQDMIAKVIPADRRGRFFGLTNFAGTATGVAGATGAAWVLARYGFPGGYLWSFAAAAAMILISWAFLAWTREPARTPEAVSLSQREYLRQLPVVLRGDRNFGRYLLSQVVLSLSSMAGGFLTVYAMQRWDLPDSQAGTYTAVLLSGQALANLLFGAIADRQGHKRVLELGEVAGILAVGVALLAPDAGWFYPVFALIGAKTAASLLSGLMIALEFCPAPLRPTYIGLNNTIRGVAFGVAPVIGGWLAGWAGYEALFGTAFAVGVAGLAMLHWSVREPREASKASPAESPGER
ncbi:MAG: MFS transporter [Anaerolineae bacterium]|nr:MFS transporter [Anaerolineae bacterium]